MSQDFSLPYCTLFFTDTGTLYWPRKDQTQSHLDFLNSAHTHLVPVDICEKQHPTLWRARFRRWGWRNRRLGNLWQSDVPRCVNVKCATRRPHQYRTCFGGPQHRLLQGPDEVVPEQLGYVAANLLISQMQTDACLADCMCHPLFICTALTEAIKQKKTIRAGHCMWNTSWTISEA